MWVNEKKKFMMDYGVFFCILKAALRRSYMTKNILLHYLDFDVSK